MNGIGNEEGGYSGKDLLIANEQSLKNYNNWIVRQFIACLNKHRLSENAVLDFGAGIGTLGAIFFKKTSMRPVAVEPDPQQRGILRERGFTAWAGIEEINGTFDMVYTSNVLEHIGDDVGALSAIKGKLAAGGALPFSFRRSRCFGRAWMIKSGIAADIRFQC